MEQNFLVALHCEISIISPHLLCLSIHVINYVCSENYFWKSSQLKLFITVTCCRLAGIAVRLILADLCYFFSGSSQRMWALQKLRKLLIIGLYPHLNVPALLYKAVSTPCTSATVMTAEDDYSMDVPRPMVTAKTF